MLLDLIQTRQSSRDYLPASVQRELIEKCIEAARLAPSACNSQPWHFIIVDEPELKNKLTEKIFSGPYSMNSFVKKAPVIVAVISEKSSFMAKIGGYFRGTAYYLIDIGAAVENFILQAAELGLSTCWIGWFNEKETKRLLGIPSYKKLDCLISLGYSQEPIRPKTRKQINKMHSYNKYQGASHE